MQHSNGRKVTTPVKLSFRHYTKQELEEQRKQRLTQARQKKATKKPSSATAKVKTPVGDGDTDPSGAVAVATPSTAGTSPTSGAGQQPKGKQSATDKKSSGGLALPPQIASMGSADSLKKPPADGDTKVYSTSTSTRITTNADGTIQREVTVTNKSTGVPFGANPFGANPFGPQAGGSGQRVSIAELQSAMGDDAIPLLKQFCDVQLSSTERTQLYEAAEPLLSADGSDVRLAAVKTLKAQATPELSERLQKLTPSSKDGKAAVALVQESIEGDRETCIEIIELLERQASGKLTEADKSKLDAKQREEEADELIKSRSRRQFLEEAILENMDKFSTARSQKAGVSALMVCGSERCLPVLKELAKTIPEAGAVIFAIQIRLKTEK